MNVFKFHSLHIAVFNMMIDAEIYVNFSLLFLCLQIEFFQFSTCSFSQVLAGAHASFVHLHVRTETLIGAGCDDVLLHLLFVA